RGLREHGHGRHRPAGPGPGRNGGPGLDPIRLPGHHLQGPDAGRPPVAAAEPGHDRVRAPDVHLHQPAGRQADPGAAAGPDQLPVQPAQRHRPERADAGPGMGIGLRSEGRPGQLLPVHEHQRPERAGAARPRAHPAPAAGHPRRPAPAVRPRLPAQDAGAVILKLIAIAGLMLTGITGWSLYDAGQPYTVRAYFLSAENLTSSNDVVIGGLDVGSVKSVQLNPDEGSIAQVIVTLQVDGRFAPLHQGTRALIRPKGLLGNMYVELTP